MRLERENVFIGGQATAVVHNYGHGGSGVTLHWGCVEDAINLVANVLGESVLQADGARSRM